MLTLPDILDHLDAIIASVRTAEGVFKSVSEAETFTKRVRDVHRVLENSSTAQPAYAQLTKAAFPSVEGESLRVSFAKFVRQLEQTATHSGHRFSLVKSSGRGLAPEEIKCHFDGSPLPKHGAMHETTRRATAGLDRMPLVRPAIATLTGAELEQAVSLPWEKDPASGKTRVRFFVSYAHRDAEAADRLLDRLRIDLNLSKKFVYEFWRDTAIEPGEKWHDSIQAALTHCDFGLALVSMDFLSSTYIRDHELPRLLDTEKPLIPVGLGRVDFHRHDLRGLEEHQIYRLTESSKEPKFYSRCTGNVAERFAADLAVKIEGIVEKSFQRRKEALLMEALADPIKAQRLAQQYPTIIKTLQMSVNTTDTESSPFPTDDAEQRQLLRDFAARGIPKIAENLVPAIAAGMSMSEAERTIGRQRSGEAEDTDAALSRFESQRQDAVRFLAGWFQNPKSSPFAAVLGEIGSGKTTMLQMLARNLAAEGAHNSNSPPVFFVDLKDHAGSKDATLEIILADQLRRHDPSGRLKPADIIGAVQTLGALIIFDGLDEKIIPLNDEQRVAFIRELWRVLPVEFMDRAAEKGRGRLVISCRSHYFPSIVAQTSGFVAQDRHAIRSGDYTACIMLPWSERQIADYLAKTLGPDKVEAAKDLIGSIHNLTDLSRRPYLLSLIVPQLAELERDRASGRPVNGARLYQTFVEKWLRRDDGKHKFTPEHKLLMMEHLAADLWRENAREWSWAKVAAWLDKFLYENSVIAARYARERISADILNQDFRTATFFLRPDSSKDGFRFAHTSLLEFFLASHLVKSLTGIESDRDHWNIPPPSLETFDFAGQIIELLNSADRERALAGLRTLLEERSQPKNSRLTAIAFVARAAKQGLPVPESTAIQAWDLDLTGWEISGTKNRPLRLARANFCGTILIRAVFRHVELPDSSWLGADLRGAEFVHSGLENSILSQTSTATLLDGALFHNCRLNGALIAGGSLNGVRITQPDWDSDTKDQWLEAIFVNASPPNSHRHIWTSPLPTGSTAPVSITPPAGQLIWSLGHMNAITSVAFSPEGRRLLTGSYDNAVHLWDADSCACICSLLGHSNGVTSVAFSPDGRRLLSGSWDCTVRIWDSDSGTCFRILPEHLGAITSVAYFPDGRHLASASYDTIVRVWDGDSGQCIRIFKGHSRPVHSISISSDGQHILSGSHDNTIRLWSTESGKCVRTYREHLEGITSVAFSPDSRQFISGSIDKTIRLWDVSSGKCLRILTGHTDTVTAVLFSPDSRYIISSSYDKSIRLWDAHTGIFLRLFKGHSNRINSVGISPNACRLASGSDDISIRLWDLKSGACLRIMNSHLSGIMHMAEIDHGSRLLTCSFDKSLRLWDSHSGVCLPVTEAARRHWEIFSERAKIKHVISPHGTVSHRRADGTEMEIAVLPNDGYAVLERAPGGKHWRLARGSEECWRYVNYASDVRPDGTPGRVLYPAEVMGPIPLE